MKERPILFSAPMVRALIDGTKSQTRRIVKPDPGPYWNPVVGLYNPVVIKNGGYEAPGPEIFGASDENQGYKCPYGQPGDRLWVRETYSDAGCRLTYRADLDDGAHCMVKKWMPSIHMFRADSRILLEIVSVRVERLNDISQADAQAEGITDGGCVNCGDPEGKCACSFPMPDYRDAYCHLWGQINGSGSWEANPWVWVVEFKRVTP